MIPNLKYDANLSRKVLLKSPNLEVDFDAGFWLPGHMRAQSVLSYLICKNGSVSMCSLKGKDLVCSQASLLDAASLKKKKEMP